ncbi:hypothetical protein TRAPUB_10078 [Trametes pubescens]|uniref:Respiratory supercomplex factor 1, mitochondrial n=1 Tax=Trametes pubescens TaxID=154538 RepID=A0A1M2W0L2_TRAPU|nr:hypothetical protein TRAPUB_10078 [Trametes pubescens]
MSRGHRKEDVEKAYQIQSRAGAIGFAQYGAVGLGLASIGHHFWPSFRRQTLPFKAFLVTIVSVYGLCIRAENALQTYEQETRLHESALRREARMDLARRGLVATETEIAKWKTERTQILAAEAEARARARAGQPTAAAPVSSQ